jgi:phospholipid/cholesterol/gamma-HCH transport system substrate-binding protein
VRASRGSTALVAAWVLGALAFLTFCLYESGGLPVFNHPYQVKFVVPSAEGIATGSAVRIAGVRVGKVTGVQRQGVAAVLTLQLSGSNVPLPADTRGRIDELTLVGEEYVGLEPGKSKRMLPGGGVLPIAQANNYVNVDRILDTLRGPTRTRARELIQSLGGAVGNNGEQLNHLLGGAAGLLTGIDPVLRTLDQDRTPLAAVIRNLDGISEAISERGNDIERLARGARLTFTAVAARDRALRQLLHELPAILTQVRSTSGILTTVTGQAAPVLSNLASAVAQLSPAIGELYPAAREGRLVLSNVSNAAPPLQQTLGELQATAPPALATLPKLQKVLCQVNPAVKYLAPYSPELGDLLHVLGSVTNYYDASTHAARLLVGVGRDSAGFLGPTESAALQLLLQNGIVGKFYSTGYNPYPAPGQVNGSTGTGFSGPAQWAPSHPYPHIQAEC